MSDLNEDLSEGLASTLTGSVGVPEDATTDDVLPNDLADAVEEQERYLAERGVPANNDVQDEAQYQADREAEQQRGRGKKVPLAALQEERQKRQQAEEALRAQALQLQQLLAQQQAAQQAQLQAQQEAAIPDFDEDPRGYIEAKEKQFAQALDQLQNGPAQQHQQFAQIQAQIDSDRATVVPAAIQLENEFRATTPDYDAAFNLVQQSVEAQLRQMYPQADAAHFDTLRTAALIGFNKQCLANGINPAAQVYKRAQELGYVPGAAPAGQQRKEPPTSLSTAHGSTRAPDERSSVRAADIADMSEAEFDQLWNSMKRGATVGPAF
jgi:hypothetical protein